MAADVIVINVFFALTAMGLWIDDVRKLRALLAVISALTIGAGMWLYDQLQWVVVQWHLLYLFIHIIRVAALSIGRFDSKLSPDEQILFNKVFPTLDQSEFKKIARTAIWNEVASGTRIVTEGSKINALRVIFRGSARILSNDETIATISSGTFIGEVSFLTDGISSATVVADGPMVIVSWPSTNFRKLLERNPNINVKTQKIFGTDLAQKFKNQGQQSA